MKEIAKQKIGKPQIEVKEGPSPPRERVTHFIPVWSFGRGYGTTKPDTDNKVIKDGK